MHLKIKSSILYDILKALEVFFWKTWLCLLFWLIEARLKVILQDLRFVDQIIMLDRKCFIFDDIGGFGLHHNSCSFCAETMGHGAHTAVIGVHIEFACDWILHGCLIINPYILCLFLYDIIAVVVESVYLQICALITIIQVQGLKFESIYPLIWKFYLSCRWLIGTHS